MADNTVFDSVFKTMVHKAPQLVVPFINEVFGRDYPGDAPITHFNTERESARGTKISDSVFRLQDKIYHIECQSTPDTSMVIRMIEYDFTIAFDQALAAGAPYEMNFPSSCVLFLRHNADTPDVLQMKVNMPGGESVLYQTKVVKAQEYESDALFDKKLLLLLPYYLMRYERELDAIAADDNKSARLVEECVDISARLASVVIGDDDRLLYEELVELIIRVSDHIMAKHDALRGKVRKAMGGEVLELLNDRAARLEREAREEGLKQGRELGLELGLEQGREQGREQGLEQGLAGLAEQLRERGVSEDLLADAIAAVHKSNEKSEDKPEMKPEQA